LIFAFYLFNKLSGVELIEQVGHERHECGLKDGHIFGVLLLEISEDCLVLDGDGLCFFALAGDAL
jgi:hypothetical protein